MFTAIQPSSSLTLTKSVILLPSISDIKLEINTSIVSFSEFSVENTDESPFEILDQ